MAKGLFSYSIGKKFIMGLTGLFLVLFLVVHCGINFLVFLNDGGETFNAAAEFMAHNWIMRTLEIGLFLGFIAHIAQSIILTMENKKARKIGYAVSNANANSKWYSRSMSLLGILILMFLIIHLKHFWIVSRFTDHFSSGDETLYMEMKEVFENPIVVVIYCLAMIALAYHLMHGFQSAFQSLGLNHKKYTPIIKKMGLIYSILIPFIFALMPLAFYFQIIK